MSAANPVRGAELEHNLLLRDLADALPIPEVRRRLAALPRSEETAHVRMILLDRLRRAGLSRKE